MKINICIHLLIILVLVKPTLHGATHVVLPGDSIQDTINTASAGDMIILKGGAYNESITIEKNIDFRRESGSTVHITGNITLSGITGSFSFAHFQIGSDSNKVLYVNNCENVYLEDVNASTGARLSVTNSKVRGKHCWFATTGTITGATEFDFYDCSFGGNVTFTSSNWTLQECSITGNLTSNTSDTEFFRSSVTGYLYHNEAGETNCTIFQSTIGGRLYTKAKRSWVGYNSIKYMDIDTGAVKAEIVGNNFNLLNQKERCIEINSVDVSVHIRNNKIKNTWSSSNEYGIYGSYRKSGVFIQKCKEAIICNNVFSRLYGSGIILRSDFGGSATITGNFFHHVYLHIIDAPFENVFFDYNFWDTQNYTSQGWNTGGVANGSENIKGNSSITPIYENGSYNFDWSTIPSTLQDKGSPDPEFKDHDGTRQDIGIFGGHHYDVNGTTSNIPVVLSANLSPMRIQKGVTGTINLNSRAVVSTPK